MLKNLKTRGFTLLETLVAVALLTTAVASAISIVSRSIQSATYARDQMTASFLASEGIELVRNLRDTKAREMLEGLASENWLESLTGSSCGGGSPCDIDPVDLSIPGCSSDGCPLSLDGSGFYRPTSGTATKFSRKIVISDNDEKSALVTVTVRVGSEDYARIEENITNWHAQASIASQSQPE